MAELLKNLYYNPATGYVGVQALYEKAQAIDPKITFKVVKDWYSSQGDIQRFQEQKNRFSEFKIASHDANSWQMDLAFWKGKTILTAININSRLGFAILLPNKKAESVLKSIKLLVKQNVEVLTSDNGKEFLNTKVQQFFKLKGITHYNNEAGDHSTMGKIERFNRTINGRLTKIGRPLSVKLLHDVISNYNNTKHRSIGMTPTQAKGKVMENELTYNQDTMDKIENEFEIGAKVLYRLTKKQFAKEDVRWSKAVYTIVGIDGYRVQIQSKNKRTLYKSPNNLKLVNEEATAADFSKGDIYEIDHILGHKKMRSGKNKYHIKWTHIDEPTWELQGNLRLVNKNRMSSAEKNILAS